MQLQHRKYRLKPGVFDEFVAVWTEQVVPMRGEFGFSVVGAWASREASTFVWIVGHDGDFAAAEEAYYASPERAAITPNPGDLIDHADVVMVDALASEAPRA
ncbi:MAG TPA: NIPSNAP family containing protein [Acidimicrobiia bacterium]|nr:NIPSNAP family containing protein [Acidimicrobiia bacterium]